VEKLGNSIAEEGALNASRLQMQPVGVVAGRFDIAAAAPEEHHKPALCPVWIPPRTGHFFIAV
jgi:hypothetical protein